MDPNACLKEIRYLVTKSRLATGETFAATLTPDEADRLVDLIDGLDKWIAGGGFLPAAWAKGVQF